MRSARRPSPRNANGIKQISRELVLSTPHQSVIGALLLNQVLDRIAREVNDGVSGGVTIELLEVRAGSLQEVRLDLLPELDLRADHRWDRGSRSRASRS